MDGKIFEEIFRAKIDGLSDADIMSKFSVGLREIEQAIIMKTGTNLNLFATQRSRHLQPKEFHLETTTVWSFKSRGKWATHSGNYRGNWSPYIPRNVILRYSKPGDIVLDQFCGGGTTAVEAKLLGRQCIARDINPGAVLLTRKNLEFDIGSQMKLDDGEDVHYFEPVVETGDARYLNGIEDESIDLICTHPPYANIVQYTDGIEGDISAHDVDEFIEDMDQVAGECYRVLKPNGHVAILIGDTRRKKRVVPIGFRTIETFLKQGFYLKDLIIKRQHNCRTTGFWYTQSIRYNFLLLSHEYLAVFTKSPPELDITVHSRASSIPWRSRIVEKSDAPKTMECRTTWILPEERKRKLIEQNVLNRYSKDKSVVIDVGNDEGESSATHKMKVDTVFIRSKDLCDNGVNSVAIYLDTMREVLAEMPALITTGGHLIIQTRDIRVGDHTIAPVLDLWKMPAESFRIREIVVVTDDKSLAQDSGDSSLQI